MSKVCLIVIDGWGVSDAVEGNAILHAETPVMDKLFEENAVTLNASGFSVGLPDGLMGNSEVGHMTIGIGRIIYQDIVRINKSITEKTIFSNKALVDACNQAKQGNGRLHFLGLVSDGGVHSHIDHLFTLLDAAKEQGVPECFVQYFADGRDTRPSSGVTFVEQLLNKMKSINYGKLATVVGRYYAMDRDKRYERIKIAYDGLCQGLGEKTTQDQVIEVIKKRYEANETDEFLKPIIVSEEGRVRDGDTMIFIDFRADRMREIVEAFGIQRNFDTEVAPKVNVTVMTEYKGGWPFPQLFPPQVPTNVLGEWLAHKKVPQFHCAETEKYAHVTFFFNGGREDAFELEDRCMVPSPKVPTYDTLPEMSSAGVADKMVEAIGSGKYPFVMCNFAPPDMVGHTGQYEPAVKACTATDIAIGRIYDACEKHGYVLLITSDHGNAEKMFSEKGGPHTAHTTARVPFIMTGSHKFIKLDDPGLADVAPTVLDLMGLDIPADMTGKSLLKK
ncbi:2,3-bisphosphoglycerate-independent phosphoglycerate mutase-like [Saccoglossus kowalevskii]|uniref:phosphoglycerate mutase (2,3-diphosphoglycerate-independent) n=1 Tax=Saccoglossus kowalevskii TaxID=10224 RepID=A0ABM0MK31_SACKO|nr:PREDICTED: 2,3-bisphosphoglycerate-independent phosphoglycerate mutase-like [Saccoglossus kowalevskii]